MQIPLVAESRNYYTIQEISKDIKAKLEDGFKFIRLRGEVSGLTYHRSGHVYFSLKEGDAVIDAIAWKYVAQKFNVPLEEGVEIIGRGSVTTYRGRSKYQFVMDSFELAGRGALFAVLEKRKKQLEAEGLFSPGHKKPLPPYPQRIGLITSRDGAVLHDIQRRLQERFFEEVVMIPATMQGEGCAPSVIAALEELDALELDVIIIARGGGSFEDLWPFNDDALCRCIHAAKTPVMTAIGHEPDTPLVDYVCDQRAPTPTAAAEMVAPKREDLQNTLTHKHVELKKGLARTLQTIWHSFVAITQRLDAQRQLLTDLGYHLDKLDLSRAMKSYMQQLDIGCNKLVLDTKLLRHKAETHEAVIEDATTRAHSALKMQIETARHQVEKCAQAVNPARAYTTLATVEESFHHVSNLPQKYMHQKLADRTRELKEILNRLENNNLLAILRRGFSVLTDQNGQVIKEKSALRTSQAITVHMHDGVVAGIFVPQSRTDRS